jgi:hypothetical protein
VLLGPGKNKIRTSYPDVLKGLSHEIDFKNFDKNLQNLAKASWFLNFLEAPMIL